MGDCSESNCCFSKFFLENDLGRINISKDSNNGIYAINWPGKIDFSEIDNVALHGLVFLLGDGNFDLTKNEHSILRILEPKEDRNYDFCSCAEEVPNPYERVSSKNIEELHNLKLLGYESLLNSLFVRYDVSVGDKGSSLTYSLFAENPKFSDENCMIEFSQPISKGPKKGLLEFIAKTHNDKRSENVNLECPLADMRKFLRSR